MSTKSSRLKWDTWCNSSSKAASTATAVELLVAGLAAIADTSIASGKKAGVIVGAMAGAARRFPIANCCN